MHKNDQNKQPHLVRLVGKQKGTKLMELEQEKV